MDSLREKKYIVVKNFLDKNECNLILNYLLKKHKLNTTDFDEIQNNNGDSYFSKDPMTEALLFMKHKKMEELTGIELYPTYSFSRVYTSNAILKKHTDRPSCEISITIMFGSCKTHDWPIYMGEEKITLESGDAVIYLGCEIPHGRDAFEGDFHMQGFLHYVDRNGPNAEYKYDKRLESSV
tara:strand:+ start:345 stop:887 length:543 start_codon:yes stop_codon:yes gene_type:complete